MAEPLFAMTARTAGQVRQLLADGGAIGGRATASTPNTGGTWVKLTSGTATSGWYPGVVSIDVGGTWSDLTTPVKVAAADGSALVSGNRYLCTRTGDDADGIARFRTMPPGGSTTTHWLEPCVAATTGNITLAGSQTIDGVSVTPGQRVLVRAQTSSNFNGIYVSASGGWTRATDCDTTAELSGAAVVVTGGTTFPNSVWALNGAIGLSFSGTLIGPYMLATQINAASTAFATNDSMYASSIRARPQGGIRLGYLGSLASNTLYMEVFEASATQNGMITTGTQTLAANKTFAGGYVYVGDAALVSGSIQINESNRDFVVAGQVSTPSLQFLTKTGSGGTGARLYGRVIGSLGAIVFNGFGWADGATTVDAWADLYGMHFIAGGAGPTIGQLRLGRYIYPYISDSVTGTFYPGLDASVTIGGLIYKFRKGILTEITAP